MSLASKGLQYAKIASGGTTSTSVDMTGKTLLGIDVPTLDTGTFTIEGSMDGTTWRNVKDTSLATVGQWASGTGAFICDADTVARFVGIPFLRFVAASQTADRTITVATC
jgi:hypothetical protein